MVESMYCMVQLKTRETMFFVCYIATSTYEVTAIDNTSWISIHIYVVH